MLPSTDASLSKMKMSIMHLLKLVSVLKREARLFQKKRKRLQHTMSQDMQYYSMYFLMSDLFIRYQ